jgi:ankyrin repeat protein
MEPRGTDAIPLPRRPNLEQYRTRAKSLVKACKSGDAAVREWARQWLEALSALHSDAQASASDGTENLRHLRWSQIEREAEAIERDARKSGLSSDAGATSCTLSDAQLFIARLHDFVSWPKFAKHIDELARENSPDAEFESAADAVVTGDLATLTEMLRATPSLARARSARDHRATLLHYTAANGHEGYRQRTPKNAVEIARTLLDAGAESDALAHMYGGDATTMDMLVSSVHPHLAGVQVALVDTLVDHGAAVDGVEANGSPLMTAIAFHYPKAAEALARRGARVENIIQAAALGRVDVVESLMGDDGYLKPNAPLSAVRWPRLPRDPQVHLEYAMVRAAAFGRTDVVKFLLEKGVNPAATDVDATALHFAAAYGHMDIVSLLLAHGAQLETLNSYGGTVLTATLWYAFNGPIERVDYAAVVRALIAAGARTDIYPKTREHIDELLTRG